MDESLDYCQWLAGHGLYLRATENYYRREFANGGVLGGANNNNQRDDDE